MLDHFVRLISEANYIAPGNATFVQRNLSVQIID